MPTLNIPPIKPMNVPFTSIPLPVPLAAYFQRHSKLTQAITAAIVVVGGTYTSSEQFREYVNGIGLQVYRALPHALVGFIATVVLPLMATYYQTSAKTTIEVQQPADPSAEQKISATVTETPAKEQ